MLGALIGVVYGFDIGKNEDTEVGFFMGNCLAQHLELWMDSHLVRKLVQS